ncbi:hypothetical protein P3342_005500 [Pyrenophora teres f. teres]|nr:hypothetical protein P3342_005500 [Pyrenophora teres f. teres]
MEYMCGIYYKTIVARVRSLLKQLPTSTVLVKLYAPTLPNKSIAKPKWGATSELSIRNTYNILNSDRQGVLRYEIDTIFLKDGEANENEAWKYASAMPAPPVYYGMYTNFNCDTKDGVDHVYIGGFQSLGEAVSSMKQAAKFALPHHHGANMFDKEIELLGEKGQVQQRYTIDRGTRDEDGDFVKEAGWDTKQAFDTSAAHGKSGSRKPGLRLPTPKELEDPIQQPPQLVLPQAKHHVQAPDAY